MCLWLQVVGQGRYLILPPLLMLGLMRYWQLVFFTLGFNNAGADALLAASVFHFGIHRIGDVKRYLSQQGYSVRTSALT
jgi:hypothetical protein